MIGIGRQPYKMSVSGKCVTLFAVVSAALIAAVQLGRAQSKGVETIYKVLAPLTQDNLTVFPIVTSMTRDTRNFLTLDEGLRSGQVVITEEGGSAGLVRPRPHVIPNPDFPIPGPRSGAEVNRLVLSNNSDRPLILLAGEIVTGGKQDRVVGKDRIIPPKGEPVDLSVFCVEPHRWVEMSERFGGFNVAMAQPSVRFNAMAKKDQQGVWDQVARSRASVAAALPAPAAHALGETSSYAVAFQNGEVRQKVDEVATPIEHSYEKLISQLRAEHAVGSVVAINSEIVWVDAFASTGLFDKYWPKLIRSYAAEAVTLRLNSNKPAAAPSIKEAQLFLDDFDGQHEKVESEPRVYRNTEIVGRDFDAFILRSLLPGTDFNVHTAKMRSDKAFYGYKPIY
ncbi:MAG: hypothetical protein JOY62_13095 [Acidobacteriaceae bacterium]|nr:hypothetical protein [Acidobacteriaceae bacterium]MBV9780897.1 hypothetical protein [Acidobacteriaceae bacterium]